MPAGYHIGTDEGLITVRVDSHVDLVDLYEMAKQLLQEQSYASDLPLLVDLRGMQLELEKTALKPFNDFIISNARDRSASCAMVIDAEMEEKLCAAIYWLACALEATELFDDYDHALKWLIRREFASGTAAS